MIIELEKKYEEDYKTLVKKLWSDIKDEELNKIIQDHYLSKEMIFLFISIKEESAVGFINTSIRNDYVEGCDSLGVGYIEGIYVCEPYRRNQIAYKLMQEAIKYFKTLGLNQIGSDTEVENVMSQIFHKSIGFKEVSTIKHYTMNIDGE